MTIDQRTSGGVIILDVQGRMTIEVLGKMVLVEKVRQLLQQGHKQLLLDMGGVPSMDTSGLSDLVGAYLAATRRDASLKLLHLTPHVRTLLKVTRLLTVFDAYESEPAAVASFRSNAPI